MGRYPETRVSMHDLINKGKPTLEASESGSSFKSLKISAEGFD
jgi:hypothetical protein